MTKGKTIYFHTTEVVLSFEPHLLQYGDCILSWAQRGYFCGGWYDQLLRQCVGVSVLWYDLNFRVYDYFRGSIPG